VELIDLTLTDTPLLLFDQTRPTNTWRIRGDIEFDFAPDFQFPPNRRVIVVGFDPDWNAEALAGFRAQYRLDAQVIILGPWRGQLNPASGTLQLFKPQSSTAEPVADVLVEELRYLTQPPWPDNADGTGWSIHHRYPQFIGSEPSLWAGLPATPGDQDGDGDVLPDLWEVTAGLDSQDGVGDNGAAGDPDQDGYTNLQEFWAGTAPLDPESHLRLEVSVPPSGRRQFCFAAGPSRSYTVLARDRWDSSEWRVFKNLRAPLEGGTITFTDSPTNATRFYRLLVK
jgi:hypothetical protein